MVSLRQLSKNAIYTAVLCSLLIVPVGIVSVYVTTGPPDPGSQRMLLFGLFAMTPGVLMGGAALLVTAQG